MLDSPYVQSTLPNGIRLATEHVPHVFGVAIGLRFAVGSRDETDADAGISHMLEHMVFKGTLKRTARDIAEALDRVGGQMDAYTSKDYTGYAARVLPEHVPLALEVMGDMLHHSRLDPEDVEVERAVILEEYQAMLDDNEGYAHELFLSSLWPDHPLGRSVIGLPEVIARLTAADLRSWLEQHYSGTRFIACAAGNLSHEAFRDEVERHFGGLPPGSPRQELPLPEARAVESTTIRPVEQAYFNLGGAGVSERDPDRWIVRLLGLLLGGGMSSRLFQEIREKHGLCYSIGAESTSYLDGGHFIIFADTSPDQLATVRKLVERELDRLMQDGVSARELDYAREQIRAGTLMSLDDTGSRMGRLAHGLMYHNGVIPLSQIVELVDAITSEDCRRVAQRLFGRPLTFAAISGETGKTQRRRKAPE